MLRVVVDTNVVVSGLLSPSGAPGAICQAIDRGLFVWCMSDALLAEYEGVLARPHLREAFARQGEGIREEFLAKLMKAACWSDGALEVVAVVTADPDDDMLLATAVGTDASMIVTGDSDLLGLATWRGIEMLSPRQFVELQALDLAEGAA